MAIIKIQVHYAAIPKDFEAGSVNPILPPEVVARSARFRFARDRNRFAFAEAFQRKILAETLGCDPADLKLEVDRRGKPILGPELQSNLQSGEMIGFNLSRCQSHVAFAIGPTKTIGVDVEDNTNVDPMGIARGNFAVDEIVYVEGRGNDQMNRFIKLWSCKEAVTKALGFGLAMPLDEFSVSQLDQDFHELQFTDSNHGLATEWSLTSREIAPNCHLAVAVRIPEVAIQWNSGSNFNVES